LPDFRTALLPKLLTRGVIPVKGFLLLLTGKDLNADLQQIGFTMYSPTRNFAYSSTHPYARPL